MLISLDFVFFGLCNVPENMMKPIAVHLHKFMSINCNRFFCVWILKCCSCCIWYGVSSADLMPCGRAAFWRVTRHFLYRQHDQPNVTLATVLPSRCAQASISERQRARYEFEIEKNTTTTKKSIVDQWFFCFSARCASESSIFVIEQIVFDQSRCDANKIGHRARYW